ncbi:acyl-CoA dehydrogenase family protein [Hyphomonas sp.]|uniref:acyl-CoA dehydrogenase family protein n=1 Tax=Hyphomonas sp. TaxID=87 RepID=UPI0025BA9C48|nr:acyl-CoA dehydrogenase family protein [Hyphomonas sp.]
MEFALSEDQRLLQDSLKGVLAGAASLDQIRKIAVGDAEASSALETALADFGLASLLVPEDAGGLGLGLLDACLVQEALGYHIAPSGFLVGALAATALGSYPDLLNLIAAGEARFGLAATDDLPAGWGRGVPREGKALGQVAAGDECRRRHAPARSR